MKKASKKKPKGGLKYDDEKPAMDLLPSCALLEIGRVLAAGRKKYGKANWTNGIEIGRLLAAAQRHTLQFNAGEDRDAETGTLHLANAATNLLMAIWMLENRPDLDDRWDRPKGKKK